MPLHGLVRHKASKQAFFIVKVYSVDMLVWEAVEFVSARCTYWNMNAASRQLQRKVVFDLEGWEEIELDIWSMMHCFAKVGASLKTVVALATTFKYG